MCHDLSLLSPVEADGHFVLDLLLRAGEGGGLGATPRHNLTREMESWIQINKYLNLDGTLESNKSIIMDETLETKHPFTFLK